MRNKLTLLIGVLLAAVLAAYMFAFQVRYDEVAVLTTFQRAGDDAVRTEPGLYFRLPWPIQDVESYSTQLQLLETELQQLQTADNFSVIAQVFLTWRIEDPLAFFRTLSSEEQAQQRLEARLADLLRVISSYEFSQMVNNDPDQLALDQIEADALAQLQASLPAEWGIAVEGFGISRLVLPETTSEQVFQRMISTRERLASDIRSQGETRGQTIRNEAEQSASQIRSFAERRAANIRTDAASRAARNYEAFSEAPELAEFLLAVDTLRESLQGTGNTTLVLSAETLDLLRLLDPRLMQGDAGTPGSGGPAE
jgi:membrane protease subunit HflC